MCHSGTASNRLFEPNLKEIVNWLFDSPKMSWQIELLHASKVEVKDLYIY